MLADPAIINCTPRRSAITDVTLVSAGTTKRAKCPSRRPARPRRGGAGCRSGLELVGCWPPSSSPVGGHDRLPVHQAEGDIGVADVESGAACPDDSALRPGPRIGPRIDDSPCPACAAEVTIRGSVTAFPIVHPLPPLRSGVVRAACEVLRESRHRVQPGPTCSTSSDP